MLGFLPPGQWTAYASAILAGTGERAKPVQPISTKLYSIADCL